MKLTILGSGAGMIKKKRKAPCFLLETASQKLLFDCGWDCPQSLIKAGIQLKKIDHIFISHSHADHMGTLMNLLQSMLITHDYIPKNARKKPLFLHGYPGFQKDYQTLKTILFPDNRSPYQIKIIEHPVQKKFKKFKVISTSVHHVPQYFPSVAYRIDGNNKSFVYSGDCGFDKNLIKLAQGANLLLIEASYSSFHYKKYGPQPGHLSCNEAGRIANEARVKKVVLFHLYDLESDKKIRKAVRKNFSGQIIIPQDGAIITI